MIILRLETQQGEGIYGVGYGFFASRAALHEQLTGEAVTAPWHPSPGDDILLSKWWGSEQRGYICGFASVHQMLDWFPREGFQYMIEKEAKHKKGVVVNQYEVDGRQAKVGAYQAMFRREDAKLVGTFSLEDFSK